ncbi:MAG: hypothetical protein A2381_03715 [Bdellovibrionales bacterium RIFOXYB1_FULL_37_110]|nr:MAG: hypothetical protein A2417_16310 [Bdellovibrionales bacterium RIFOXYC1_FULL_37_79]OFZ59143.1 MAG: hypothetical protein A2381_03715 [Bdellovibrionales bacterium RIFOXYB1_FULL_37_110]OFZ64148.1 MAG: hypothetical protein A2577_14745 [Bdellovibrionales bacterium RIFOXYD1_FULL_36_51]
MLVLSCVPGVAKKCKQDEILVKGMCVPQDGEVIATPTPSPVVLPTSTPTPIPAITPTISQNQSCGVTPHNGTESRIAYSVSSVPAGQSCSSYQQTQTKICNNGIWSVWSGNYTYLSCIVQPALGCGNIASGQFEMRTRYQSANVSENSVCVSEIQNRQCVNGQLGAWSGSYAHSSCVVSRIRYESAAVSSGATCKQQTQLMTCENGVCGVWVPSNYTFSNCSIEGNDGNIAYFDLKKDAMGWTIFKPSMDSRILYVSAAGNDSTGVVYAPNNSAIGSNPFQPTGAISAFKTYSAAFGQTREGYSDWILFKRGDSFNQVIGNQVRSGRSAFEPFLVASYGSSGMSPVLLLDSITGYNPQRTKQWIALSGISFYAYKRDPQNSSFSMEAANPAGLDIYSAGDHSIKNILIEGCKFMFVNGNVIQGENTKNALVRRNVFLHSYSKSSHAQGLYSGSVEGLIVEENIFDHNGWLVQSSGGNVQAGGQATMFNHNTYIGDSKSVVLKGNIFSRPSSIQNKFTANKGEASSSLITVENNFYIDGEVGLSLGGNTDGPLRFKDVKFINNVMTDMNISRPTNRTLAWAIDILDWDGGLIDNNYIINSDHGNSFVFRHIGTSRNVTISNNHVYNFKNLGTLFGISGSKGDAATNMVFSNNKIQLPASYGRMISADYVTKGKWVFSGNQYFSERFDNGSFRHNGVDVALANWKSLSGDDALIEPVALPAVMPSVPGYMTSLGQTGTISAFIEKCRAQDRYNWDARFMGAAVNNWFRGKFQQE